MVEHINYWHFYMEAIMHYMHLSMGDVMSWGSQVGTHEMSSNMSTTMVDHINYWHFYMEAIIYYMHLSMGDVIPWGSQVGTHGM